ncbi:MAG: ABC transporter ATP-binding protein [Halobacteriota archaeon]
MIEFDHVFMNFGKKEVLKDVSFSINDGENFTFIGPSGSGKTTILRLINMLQRPTSGKILIDGTNVTLLRDREKIQVRRKMSMVFQKPSPLRGSVYANTAVGLRFRKVKADEISRRVSESLELVGLEGYEGRRADTLSGGEMQRVALARAIATTPEVLLLDEPTANLDPVSTETIESLIGDLKNRSGVTVILSTHDMEQGQRLADRIAVLIDGRIGQIGSSKEIFYNPMNQAVAHMVGVENIFDGVVTENDAGLAVIAVNGIRITAASSASPGTPVTLYMRPEDITFYKDGSIRSSARNTFTGQISEVIPTGPMVRLKVDAGVKMAAVVTQRSFEELGLALGKETELSFKASAIHVVERNDTN